MASSSTGEASPVVTCPICSRQVSEQLINQHIDAGCRDAIPGPSTPKKTRTSSGRPVAPIFKTKTGGATASARHGLATSLQQPSQSLSTVTNRLPQKRKLSGDAPSSRPGFAVSTTHSTSTSLAKQSKAAGTIGSRLQAASPLAERLRPSTLDEFVGQAHLTGPGSFLSALTEKGAVGSIILWGPPGCGKTTLARLIAKHTNANFKELSATAVGINDIRPIFDEAKGNLQLTGSRTILFLDEIHRFSRSQQDIFLPFLERGFVQLIGTTTENPSFKLNGALLSRCRVFVLERLTDDEIIQIIKRAVARVTPEEERHVVAIPSSSPAVVPLDISSPSPPPSSSPTKSPRLSSQANVNLEPSMTTPMSLPVLFPQYPHVTEKVISSMASLSAGDARTALSLLEQVLLAPAETPESALLDSMKRSVATSYDRTGDMRYDLISALHKSIRGSQGGAALYWLARMLEADEDPMYIARRLVVCASEDIGTADPHALPLAMAALQACQAIGMPECRINLAHVVTYLSEAPKSIRALEAYNRARELAKQDMTLPVPMSMRNAPNRLMKELGYGEDYKYQPQYAYGLFVSDMMIISVDGENPRHPVTNAYLPPPIRGEMVLCKEGDSTGKKWDEGALRQWEEIENGGQAWAGRQSAP